MMLTQKPFLVFGEALWDIFPDKRRLGGAPLNFAVYFLKAGGNPVLISAVGNDPDGKNAVAEISKHGLGTYHIQTKNRKTGAVIIEMQNHRHRFRIIPNTAWEEIDFPDDPDLPKNACGLYLGTLARSSKHNRKVLNRLLSEFQGRPILLDLNLRQRFYQKNDIQFLLGQVNYLKLNDTEVRILKRMGLVNGRRTEHVIEFFVKEYNIDFCCVTLGAKGAVGADRNEIVRCRGIPACNGGNSVGAGDAFAAFWMAELIRGAPMKQALTRANEIGSLVASMPGAIVDT